tara:strand:+ start:107 stop:376 length:270 start_codon:yes stop_codon:yes gene_type:complete
MSDIRKKIKNARMRNIITLLYLNIDGARPEHMEKALEIKHIYDDLRDLSRKGITSVNRVNPIHTIHMLSTRYIIEARERKDIYWGLKSK